MNPSDGNQSNSLTIIQPEMQVSEFDTQKTSIMALVNQQMKPDVDFGIIPGTQKKTLLQPGAEKLAKLFGLGPEFNLLEKVEDWDKGFFYFRYQCKLIHLRTGIVVGNAERSCNSGEKKYAFASVNEKWATEEQKSQSIAKEVRQSNGYTNTFLKVPKTPQEVADNVNTIMAMAQKRALVAAVRTATMATDIFIDDVGESKTGPAKKADDPTRTNLIAKLQVAAKERGFDDATLHDVIDKMYKVKSVTDLSNPQIYDLTEKFVSSFEVRKAGEKPVKIIKEPKTVHEVTTEEEVKEAIMDMPTEIIAGNEGKCYFCQKVLPEGKKYFCDDECKDAYWEEAQKSAKEKYPKID